MRRSFLMNEFDLVLPLYLQDFEEDPDRCLILATMLSVLVKELSKMTAVFPEIEVTFRPIVQMVSIDMTKIIAFDEHNDGMTVSCFAGKYKYTRVITINTSSRIIKQTIRRMMVQCL